MKERCNGKRVFCVASVLIFACALCSAASSQLKPEKFFDTKDAVIYLVPDGKAGLYAYCNSGSIVRISDKAKSTKVIDGINANGWTFPCIASKKDGSLILGSAMDSSKNLIESISAKGERATVYESKSEIIAMTVGLSNELYFSCYRTDDAELSISTNPSRINWADSITGEIWKIDATGNATRIYEGGLPMSLAVDAKGALYAAIWGDKGAFKPEQGETYGISDPRFGLFRYFTRNNRIAKIEADGSETLITDKLLSVSSILSVKPGIILAYAMEDTDVSGFYIVKEKVDPVAFIKGELVDWLPSCAIVGTYLYMGDVEGLIRRVSIASIK